MATDESAQKKPSGGASSTAAATPPPGLDPIGGNAEEHEPVERKSKTPLKIVHPSTPPPISQEGPISTPPAGVILGDSVKAPSDPAPSTGASRSGLILKKPGDSGKIPVPPDSHSAADDDDVDDDAATRADATPLPAVKRRDNSTPRPRSVVETEQNAAPDQEPDADQSAPIASLGDDDVDTMGVTQVEQVDVTQVPESAPTQAKADEAPTELDATAAPDDDDDDDDADDDVAAKPTLTVGDDDVDPSAPTMLEGSPPTMIAPAAPEAPRPPAVKAEDDAAAAEPAETEKPAVAKPTVAKPQVAKPTVAKPTVAKPTVAKPSVAKPAERGPDPDVVDTTFDVSGGQQKPTVAKPNVKTPAPGVKTPAPAAKTPAPSVAADVAADSRELGLMLQHAREEREMSIEQVAETTHIRPNLIELLERQAYDDMPVAAVYTRTYIKTLCKLYDLSPTPFLDDLEAHMAGRGNNAISTTTHVSPQKMFKTEQDGEETLSSGNLTRAFVILAVVVVVLLAAALVGRNFFGGIKGSSPDVPAEQIEDVLPAETLPTRALPIPAHGGAGETQMDSTPAN